MTGRIHSIETLGGLDGPGIRCVVFLQGCPMRCQYCHNPDTWDAAAGTQIDSAEVAARIERCRSYFGRDGGVTLSGGEPLMQAAFAADILARCKAAGIHTAVDTCGYYLTDAVKRALELTDLVILDIKHTDPRRHMELTGAPLSGTLAFLDYVAAKGIALWVRQVIVPGWNDSSQSLAALAAMVKDIPTLQRVELLPFRKLGAWKYERLRLPCRLADAPEPDDALMARLRGELAGLLADRHG